VREAKAAEKDEKLANKIKVKIFDLNKSYVEPVEDDKKIFKPPVFLVDPQFTEDKKEDERLSFESNDHGGWAEPRVHSRWPIVVPEVQKFFKVNGDCTCNKEVC